jgi:hypothetical protein
MRNILQLPALAEFLEWPIDDDPTATTQDGARQLLTVVLALALKDNASSVHYRFWRRETTGESVLTYVVGGVRYEMVPPPLEIAGPLFDVARTLLVPRGLWGNLRRLLGRIVGGCSGQFSLLDANGNRSEWCGTVWSAENTAGLELYRYYPPEDRTETTAVGLESATDKGVREEKGRS